MGMAVGQSLQADGLYPNVREFSKGLGDTLANKKTRFTNDEFGDILEAAFQARAEERENERRLAGEKNRLEEEAFLAENSQQAGIIVTESGLQYEIISEGSGQQPAASDVVRVHYKGTLADGSVFDNSLDHRDEPVELPVDGLIPGWSEGLQLMHVGGTYRLIIPSDLAYGWQGMEPVIPPFSTLIFEIELFSILTEDELQQLQSW